MKMQETRTAIRTHSFSGRCLADYPSLVAALFEVKEACAMANSKAGEISAEAAQKIVAVCQEACRKPTISLLKVDPFQGGGGISINQNINEYISEKLETSVSTADINRSQSTADVLHTALRITLYRNLEIFAQSIDSMESTCGLKRKEFFGIETISRTCLRDALPTTMDKLFEGYQILFSRKQALVSAHLEALLRVNLGGTVIGSRDGASESYFNSVMAELVEVTGLDLLRKESLYDAAQNSDDLAEFASFIGGVAIGVLKIARDIRLLASGPISGYSNLDIKKVIKGSSFFPEKSNPTIPETAMQACWRTQGLLSTAQLAFNQAELDLNVFEPFAGVTILEALVSMNSALRLLDQRCLKSISINSDVCAEQLQKFRENQKIEQTRT